jgi:hypothetical protein
VLVVESNKPMTNIIGLGPHEPAFDKTTFFVFMYNTL